MDIPGIGTSSSGIIGPAFTLAAAIFVSALGCSQADDPSENATASEANTIRTEPPERIISLSPNLTEIIYALGEQDRLVGVTRYCRFPPEAQSKPKVGALANTNYEKIIQIAPDLVFLLPTHAEIAADLDRLGLASVMFPHETIEDMFESIRIAGRELDRGDKADALVVDLRERLDRAGRRLRDRAEPADAPRVLFVVGRNPGTLQQLYGCGSGNFIDQLLLAVGARNVLQNTVSPWPVVSKEHILKLDPDIILDASIRVGEMPGGNDLHMKAWDQLNTLTAVRAGRVIGLNDPHMTVPGPGIVGSAEALAALIDRALAEHPLREPGA